MFIINKLLLTPLSAAMAVLCYIVLLCCFATVPAMIVTSPADTDVLMPNVVNLTCAASGVPPANFTWEITYLDGSTVSLTESSGDITIMSATENMLTTSTLTIDPTERLDTGNYTCIAENDRNDNISVSDPAEVNVFGKRSSCVCVCVCVCVYANMCNTVVWHVYSERKQFMLVGTLCLCGSCIIVCLAAQHCLQYVSG